MRFIRATGVPFFCRVRLTPYPIYGPCGLPLISSPRWLTLLVLVISKPSVALSLTGATALGDLVARRRRNAPPPGKTPGSD
ncbi:hypothetical protein RBG07_04970 [Klebsiella aerogenes]|uniref:hypothetical protein n=1 Tax=Klebsiella aerogenes TaxID=548 RepID=UPI0028E019BD|nr:hypothetical protein [Klebsiella aerogenes]MDT8881886.1 hypothetical protein [Klebsiella aerogenes]